MQKEIEKILKEAIEALQKAKNWPILTDFKIVVDQTKDEKFGDYSSNIAMVLAKKIGQSPLEIAKVLVKAINEQIAKSKIFSKVEFAPSGYVNFYLSPAYLQSVVKKINSEKAKFGNSKIGREIKVNNEFISANPTGPLHLGNGRGGFFGDALSNVLRKVGYEVMNEYYVNDAGEQVLKLGHSVLKDSEAVYAGDYIDELKEKYKNISEVKEIGERAAKDVLENIIKKTVAEKMQIRFDEWMSEKYLYDEGFVEKSIKLLQEKNLTYEKDGAVWLKTTNFGDDKDRVLIKKDGQKTYFASDCGYILNKIERGFGKIIETWGADHHGYISRFAAAAKALGFSGEVKFIIVQLVRLVKDGKEVKMSKRAGNVVYIDELIEKVGHDTARFFFLLYSPDAHMNFDLKLAQERSEKNPVFYVQYAHARICSLLEKVQGNQKLTQEKADLTLLTQEKELSLIKELEKFPALVAEVAENYAVHKLAHSAIKLADKFHSFYNDCKVLDEDNLGLTFARLELVSAVKIVLAEILRLIGVKAPEHM
jgi:arginyl-tRNA synthetase